MRHLVLRLLVCGVLVGCASVEKDDGESELRGTWVSIDLESPEEWDMIYQTLVFDGNGRVAVIEYRASKDPKRPPPRAPYETRVRIIKPGVIRINNTDFQYEIDRPGSQRRLTLTTRAAGANWQLRYREVTAK